ncbi:LPXTG cell wall anchor domain-containing protein, partial [Enterococcus sp. S181_ASV_20]|nr:LPXTG cell wall anchor domain-containing protein [Enterococcus sp. S181_ASV_20]
TQPTSSAASDVYKRQSYDGGSYDSGGSLPQTGEQVLKILPYIGLVIVVLAGALYFYRKRQI